MSNWLTRFDTWLITYTEDARLQHRVRVAWCLHQFSAVLAGFSDWFRHAYPFEDVIRMAASFAYEGNSNPDRIREFLDQTAQLAQQLQGQGYPLSLFQAEASLLYAIAEPNRVDPGKPMSEVVKGQAERLVSRLGMAFGTIQCWRQGVTSGDPALDPDYHDFVQAGFYRFSREGYAIAVATTDETLRPGLFDQNRLDWTIDPVLDPKLVRAATYGPPPHECPPVIPWMSAAE